MLSPSEYEHLCDQLITLYDDLDNAIINDMVKRMMKTGKVTEATAWQAKQLQQSGMLYEDILEEIAKRTDATRNQVRTLFEDAGVQSIRNDNRSYKAAGLETIVKMSDAALQTLNAGYKKCMGDLSNLTLTTANTSQTAYIKACNLAYMEVTSGTMDYGTAIRRAVQSAADEGSWILYPSGHRDRLDVAVRRSVLTGVGQTVRKISEINANDMDCDIMEITAHAGARPSHAEWQGQFASLSGKNAGRKIDSARVYSLKEIGYGTGDGFGGWNCRHDWFPFFEGISSRAYSNQRLKDLNAKNIEYNGKMYSEYEIDQMQRALERKVRERKRAVSAADTAVKNAPDDQTANQMKAFFTEQSVKLKQAEKNLSDFISATGNLPDGTRTWVNGFGRSTAQKAVWANRKAQPQPYMAAIPKNNSKGSGGSGNSPKNSQKILDNSQNNGIINSNRRFSPAPDISKAEDYARNVLGIQNVSYRGVDITTANEWNRGLASAFERFPELRNRIRFVGTCQERNRLIEDAARSYFTNEYLKFNGRISEDTLSILIEDNVHKYMKRLHILNEDYAQNCHLTGFPDFPQFHGVTVSESYGSDSESFVRNLTENVRNRIHPAGCDTIKSVLDHEIGHQLDRLLGISNNPEIQDLFDSITNNELTDMLSEYSWNNSNPNKYSERIAEAWSEYCNNPEPRPISKFVGDIILKAYEEKFNK